MILILLIVTITGWGGVLLRYISSAEARTLVPTEEDVQSHLLPVADFLLTGLGHG